MLNSIGFRILFSFYRALFISSWSSTIWLFQKRHGDMYKRHDIVPDWLSFGFEICWKYHLYIKLKKYQQNSSFTGEKLFCTILMKHYWFFLLSTKTRGGFWKEGMYVWRKRDTHNSYLFQGWISPLEKKGKISFLWQQIAKVSPGQNFQKVMEISVSLVQMQMSLL